MLAGGGQICERQHWLSDDGKLLLACAGAAVRGYSALTGEQVLELRGHGDDVTALDIKVFTVCCIRTRF